MTTRQTNAGVNTGFTFVDAGAPNDATRAANRRRIRSHVSKRQHRQARENWSKSLAAQTGGGTSNYEDASKDPPGHAPSVGHTEEVEQIQRAELGPDEYVIIAPNTKYSKVFSTSTHGGGGGGDGGAFPSVLRRQRKDSGVKVNSPDRTKTPFPPPPSPPLTSSIASFPTFALKDSENVIGKSLDALQLDLSSVLALYKTLCHIQGQDVVSQFSLQNGNEDLSERFFRFVFMDPALLSVAILVGTRNQLDVLGRQWRPQDKVPILQFETFLISSINEALSDPNRSVSDQMLVAISLCAAYELKHGDPRSYDIHMRGLVRMMQLRGGLAALEDRFLASLLMWLDINTTMLAGCERYLGDVDDRPNAPKANTLVFRAPPTIENRPK